MILTFAFAGGINTEVLPRAFATDRECVAVCKLEMKERGATSCGCWYSSSAGES